MKSFKQFIEPEEFIAFSNAGGPPGQYDKFDYTESNLYGRGGGPPEEVEENLNPRVNPEFISTKSKILYDPERDNKGLGEERNSPENIGIADYHGNGHVIPHFTDEQARTARRLHESAVETNSYHDTLGYNDILEQYTENSFNLNNELLKHHRMGSKHPETIDANYPGSPIHIPSFDRLIDYNELPEDTTVYSGLHFHPNEHRGKIAHLPAYMSTSLSPHVAKDFGKPWEMGSDNGSGYRTTRIKNILRLHLPKGHPGLFTDPGSHFPGQGEIILPRNMRYQLGQKPTHIVQGRFNRHFGDTPGHDDVQYHIWTGRILPRK